MPYIRLAISTKCFLNEIDVFGNRYVAFGKHDAKSVYTAVVSGHSDLYRVLRANNQVFSLFVKTEKQTRLNAASL